MTTSDDRKKEEIATLRRRKVEMDNAMMLHQLSNKHGRRMLAILFDQAGVFKPTFDGSSRTYYKEGQRELILPLYNHAMEVDSTKTLLAIKEYKKETQANG